MGCMARDVLMRAAFEPKSILIYGAGLSRDHAWLKKEYPDIRVCICDLANFQQSTAYVPLESKEQFDIVIACEVVEHFTDIEKDFFLLLSKVSDNGLVVLSTNISDGTAFSELAYPFVPGHTAYYSGRALMLIAKKFNQGLEVDFRVPQAALAQLGPRKRYVLIYRDRKVASAIADYFSKNLMAPSEKSFRPAAPTRWWRRLQKKLRH
jgi:hypothetical protein